MEYTEPSRGQYDPPHPLTPAAAAAEPTVSSFSANIQATVVPVGPSMGSAPQTNDPKAFSADPSVSGKGEGTTALNGGSQVPSTSSQASQGDSEARQTTRPATEPHQGTLIDPGNKQSFPPTSAGTSRTIQPESYSAGQGLGAAIMSGLGMLGKSTSIPYSRDPLISSAESPGIGPLTTAGDPSKKYSNSAVDSGKEAASGVVGVLATPSGTLNVAEPSSGSAGLHKVPSSSDLNSNAEVVSGEYGSPQPTVSGLIKPGSKIGGQVNSDVGAGKGATTTQFAANDPVQVGGQTISLDSDGLVISGMHFAFKSGTGGERLATFMDQAGNYHTAVERPGQNQAAIDSKITLSVNGPAATIVSYAQSSTFRDLDVTASHSVSYSQSDPLFAAFTDAEGTVHTAVEHPGRTGIAVVDGIFTLSAGDSADFIDGQTMSLDPAASNVGIDGIEVPFSSADLGEATSALTTFVDATGHSHTAFEQLAKGDKAIVDGTISLTAGGLGVTADGKKLSLGTNGLDIATASDSSSASLGTVQAVVTFADAEGRAHKAIEEQGNKTAVVVDGSVTLSGSGAAVTIGGETLRLGNNGLVVDGTSLSFSANTTASPASSTGAASLTTGLGSGGSGLQTPNTNAAERSRNEDQRLLSLTIIFFVVSFFGEVLLALSSREITAPINSC